MSGTEKGSLLIFSKIEIRWDATGGVIQDTFLELSNDLAAPVLVNMYFVNGDPPLEAANGERSHPGWNWVDVRGSWTANQPAHWSALTGAPGPGGASVAPFTVLDPSNDMTRQGRPATDGSGDRVLRGYVIAFAVDSDSCGISWNHLSGGATVINYLTSAAWSYTAWAFPDAGNLAPGTPVGTCGRLDLDGVSYVAPYSLLLVDFYAPGADAFGNRNGPGGAISVDTDLTLHPLTADFRQEGTGPVTTKASFVLWNEDETQFTNLHRCITCWDQTLLSLYTEGGVQNHFLSLQTNKGKARIDGLPSILCSNNCCLERSSGGCADFDCQTSVCQVDPTCCSVAWSLDCAAHAVQVCDACDSLNVDAPLLGVANKQLAFGAAVTFAAAGTSVTGMGTEPTSIHHDASVGGGEPPSLTMPRAEPPTVAPETGTTPSAVGDVLEWIERDVLPKSSGTRRR